MKTGGDEIWIVYNNVGRKYRCENKLSQSKHIQKTNLLCVSGGIVRTLFIKTTFREIRHKIHSRTD